MKSFLINFVWRNIKNAFTKDTAEHKLSETRVVYVSVNWKLYTESVFLSHFATLRFSLLLFEHITVTLTLSFLFFLIILLYQYTLNVDLRYNGKFFVNFSLSIWRSCYALIKRNFIECLYGFLLYWTEFMRHITIRWKDS